MCFGVKMEMASTSINPSADTAAEFAYSFSAWPDEKWEFDPAVFELFALLGSRVEINATPHQFERFRSSLSHHGITLREITRVPAMQPEAIQ